MLYGAMNFPVMPVLSELEEIKRLGFDYLELAMDPPLAHHKMIREQKERLLRALEDFKMGLVCHLPTFVSTADLTESMREASLNEVLESVKVAADLHAFKAVLHPSFIVGLSVFVMNQARQYAFESLEAIVEKFPMAFEDCIIITGNASNDVVDMCVASDITYLLEKPIRTYALQFAVRAIVAKYIKFAKRLLRDTSLAGSIERFSL